MGCYAWKVETRQINRAVQRAAKAKFEEARRAWHETPVGDFPSHTLDECAWTATITAGGWCWTDGGSSERIAVQRVAAHVLKGAHP